MKNDYQTSTVDGAMGFERNQIAESLREDEEFYNRDGSWDEQEHNREDDYDENDCSCSDPGCPCGGVKYGRL